MGLSSFGSGSMSYSMSGCGVVFVNLGWNKL